MTGHAHDIHAIFNDALEHASDEERARYLDEVCRDAPAVRERVEALLRAHFDPLNLLGQSNPVTLPTVDPPEMERPGTWIGPYHLVEQLGEGGMGVVFLARQEEPVARQVALKIIKPGTETRRVMERFDAERHALSVMDHPHVAKVLDAGSTPSGRPYFVMEWVQGVSITSYCDEHNLSIGQRLELFILVCEAVQHAHQKGVIHRDLKPSNILVTLCDGRPVPKVIDFGVAKAISQASLEKATFTQDGQIVGTPEYMSPEQAQSHALIDTRSDVYSLGVVLYELLTGDTPLDRQRLRSSAWDEIMRVIREEEPPKPSTKLSSSDALPSVAACRSIEPARLGALVRGELDWIVMKALDKDRERRYESPAALARDIENHLHDKPVQAGPPSASYRFRKFARRNKRTLATLAAIALAMLGGTTASLYQAVRATRAEQLAEIRLTEVERQRDVALQAEAKAERARGEAEQLQQREAAVASWLIEVFRSPDPRRDGRTITVAELLDQAVRGVEVEFEQDPRLQGKLLGTIGETYSGIGLVHEATRWTLRARDLLHDAVGPEDPDTLSAMAQLAAAYSAAGRWSEAVPLAEETLRLRRGGLGPDHPATLDSLSELTVLYIYLHRFREALPLAEEGLRLSRAALGPEHRDTLRAMNNLAGVHYQAGRFAEALQLLQQVVDLTNKVLGPDHLLTITSMADLAATYDEVGQSEEGLRLAEQALELCQMRLGSDHPETLRIRNNVAQGYIEAGRTNEGLHLHGETVRLMREKLGPEHPDTLGAVDNLAWAYSELGRWDDAIPLFQETLVLRKRILGPQHTDTFASSVGLAQAYVSTGQVMKAAPLIMESLVRQLGGEGPLQMDVLESLQFVAEIAADSGQLDRAAMLLEKVLEGRQANQGGENSDTIMTMLRLADIQLQRGAVSAAERLLLDAHARLVERQRVNGTSAADVQQIQTAVRHLVQLYETTNQPEKTSDWRKKLAELTGE